MKRLMLSVAVASLVSGSFAAYADNSLTEDGFYKVPSARKYNQKELDEYVEFVISQREIQKKIDSGKLILPNDPNRNWKRSMNVIKGTAGFAFDVLAPIGTQVAVRALGDVVINYAAPYFIEYTGKAAAGVASAASSWWTQYDPTGLGDKFVRGTAKATAQGEAYRDVGTIAEYVQKYAVPVCKSTYRAGKAIGSGVVSATEKVGNGLVSGYRAVTSRLSSWFGGQSTAATAA